MELKFKNNEDIFKIDDPVIKFKKLEETNLVKHCFTTRLGGVSEGIFSSMNLSFTRGDDPQKVRENYRRVAKLLDVDLASIVCSDQTHTTNVRLVTKKDAGNGVVRDKDFFNTDGLITNERGLTLATFYADCVPLFFVDPENKAIGLSHSGWRGTVNRMGRVTVEKMAFNFGTKPYNLICAIGPSICQDCYEVGPEVAEEFISAFKGNEDKILYKKNNGKYQLNLWEANKIVLMEAGVLEKNIAVTNVCTCCNPEILFSHRASKGKRGNLGAFLALE